MKWTITKKEALLVKNLLQLTGKKLLLYHNDPDGICSAALLLKFFTGFETMPRKGPLMDEEFTKSLIEKKPELIVFLDIPVDQERKMLKKLFKALPDLRILILDHHIPEKNLNSENIVHINPRFKNKDLYIPTSGMVYVLLKKLRYKVTHLVWMAAVGIIGDYGTEDCKDIIEECKEEYPYLLEEDPMTSPLAEVAKLISSAVTLKGLKGAATALKVLSLYDYFDDFIKVEKLQRWKGMVEKEINRLLEEFERGKERKGDVIFYKIETKLNLTSVISTILSEKYQKEIIVIRKKSSKGWKISVRNQSGDYNVGELVKRAVQGIGSGGGHEKAAAGIISKWREFKRKFLEEIRKNS